MDRFARRFENEPVVEAVLTRDVEAHAPACAGVRAECELALLEPDPSRAPVIVPTVETDAERVQIRARNLHLNAQRRVSPPPHTQ